MSNLKGGVELPLDTWQMLLSIQKLNSCNAKIIMNLILKSMNKNGKMENKTNVIKESVMKNAFYLLAAFSSLYAILSVCVAQGVVTNERSLKVMLAPVIISVTKAAIWVGFGRSLPGEEKGMRRCSVVVALGLILGRAALCVVSMGGLKYFDDGGNINIPTMLLSAFAGLVGLVIAVVSLFVGVRLVRRYVDGMRMVGVALLVDFCVAVASAVIPHMLVAAGHNITDSELYRMVLSVLTVVGTAVQIWVAYAMMRAAVCKDKI